MTRSDDPHFRRSNGFVGWCEPCDKRAFANRKSARRAARHAGGRMQAYPCPVGQLWHFGHIPADVRNGTFDKHEWLRGKR